MHRKEYVFWHPFKYIMWYHYKYILLVLKKDCPENYILRFFSRDPNCLSIP